MASIIGVGVGATSTDFKSDDQRGPDDGQRIYAEARSVSAISSLGVAAFIFVSIERRALKISRLIFRLRFLFYEPHAYIGFASLLFISRKLPRAEMIRYTIVMGLLMMMSMMHDISDFRALRFSMSSYAFYAF